jgi:hypothetical protein
LLLRPFTHTTLSEEAVGSAGWGFHESLPSSYAGPRDDVDSNPAPSARIVDDCEAKMVGIGAGLLEPWTPRSKSPNLLSDLTVADVSQQAFVNYNIVDDYFTYESTPSSALWSLPIAGIDSDYDYNFDMDSAPSTLP